MSADISIFVVENMDNNFKKTIFLRKSINVSQRLFLQIIDRINHSSSFDLISWSTSEKRNGGIIHTRPFLSTQKDTFPLLANKAFTPPP